MAEIEKVIKGLEGVYRCISPVTHTCGDCPYQDNHVECERRVINDAIILLKEQEMVKPKQIIRKQCKKEYEDGSIDYFAEWYCPHCDSLLVLGFDNKWIQFCPRCGKPITWEG